MHGKTEKKNFAVIICTSKSLSWENIPLIIGTENKKIKQIHCETYDKESIRLLIAEQGLWYQI